MSLVPHKSGGNKSQFADDPDGQQQDAALTKASPRPPILASGRKSRRHSNAAGNVKAIVSMNFRSNRNDCNESAKFARGPAIAMKRPDAGQRANAQGQEKSRAKPHSRRPGIGGERVDELGRFHSVALRQAEASAFNDRCRATRTAPSVIDRRAAVAAIDCPSSEMERTMSRWRGASCVNETLRVAARVRIFGFRRGENRLEILDRLKPAGAAPAHCIDDLVASDRRDPGREAKAAVPGVALQVDRQQRFLHNILDICVAGPRPRKGASRHRPNRPPNLLEQSPIDRLDRPRLRRASFRPIFHRLGRRPQRRSFDIRATATNVTHARKHYLRSCAGDGETYSRAGDVTCATRSPRSLSHRERMYFNVRKSPMTDVLHTLPRVALTLPDRSGRRPEAGAYRRNSSRSSGFGVFRDPRGKLYGRRRAPASPARGDSRALSAVAARRWAVDRVAETARPRASCPPSRARQRAINPGFSQNISPGRAMTKAI